MAPVATKGHADTHSLGQHLRPCWSLRVKLPLGPYKPEWPALPPRVVALSESKLQLRVMSGFVTLPQSGSVLISMASIIIEGQADARGLGCYLGTC